MKTNLGHSKWFPVFILALILLFIYNMLGNFASVTAEVSRFLNVLSPLLYGILFTYFLYIPHAFFERLFSRFKLKFISKRARICATFLTFIFLVALIIVVISVVLPVLFPSIIDLIDSIPGYVTFLTGLVQNLPADSFWASLDIIGTITDNVTAMANQLISAATLEQLALGIISFASELLNIVLGLVISLYILMDRDRILDFLQKLSVAVFKSEKRRTRITRYVHQINKVLFTFIASKGLDSIVNLVVVSTLLLIFDVPFALLLGIMAAVFNFIPYLGSLIAVITIALITVVTSGVGHAVQVLIPLFIFQQLDGNFIEPRIMKSSLKISPILVIIAVVVGGAYLGIVGMFLAVPIAVIIKQILLEYMDHKKEDDPKLNDQ
ncbi:MAG: AI-2E family transporter [Oscillospiraceae bacterium]|nr:AI-2E family transporter [Oscillospiraceae bacterium]